MTFKKKETLWFSDQKDKHQNQGRCLDNYHVTTV